MTTHFGFFTVIQDTPTIVLTSPAVPPGNLAEDVKFKLQDDTTLGDGGVLTFMTDAVSPNNLTFTMAINGHLVIPNGRVDSSVRHSEQEAVPGGVFQHGENELTIKITGGTGTLLISDIVLHYVRLL